MKTKIDIYPTIIAALIFCFCIAYAFASNGQTRTCNGTTKKGEKCKSTFVMKGTEFCRMHQPNAEHCKFIKRDKSQCKMIIKKGATYCRFHENKTSAYIPTF